MFERALKICKKIVKIRKKSGSRVNTWVIQKKRPKKSWTSKKIQTHEFVEKNNKKTASGGLRPPSGGPSGHLETPKGVSSYVAEKVVRLWCNHFLPSYPNLRQILDQRRRRRKDFFWIYNILFVNKKTTEIGLTMCRKVRFHVWKLIWNGPLKRNTLSESQRSQSKKKISGFKKVVPTGSNRIPWPLQPDISVW